MLFRRALASAAVILSISAGSLTAAGTATADVPVTDAGCAMVNIWGSAGFTQCVGPAWHRVKVTCQAWPMPFVYWRYGPAQYHGGQSWASCDVPFTLLAVEVAPG